jgi:hypothetical protein
VSSRNAARLAYSLLSATLVLTAATAVMQGATLSTDLPQDFGSRAADMVQLAALLPFVIVGALIAARRPSNSIGWLILAGTMVVTLDTLVGEYALRGLVVDPGSLPAADVAAWAYQWVWFIPVALLSVLFVVFPSGKAAARAGRWTLVPTWVAVFLMVGPVAVWSWPHRGRELLLDPDSISELEGVNALVLVALALVLGGLILSVMSLLVRWRKSVGDERLQIKWFLASGFVVFIDFSVNAFVDIDGVWRQLVSAAALVTVPVAIGVAILRYRLYDIDRIISRTLAYGALTAILAGGYLLGVLVLQSVLPVDDDSPLIVAVSTLGVVAAFRPLLGHIQKAVDRRFNRSRYDAERTISEFGGRLRNEVEIGSLSDDLIGVISRTMQPAHVSLWLRPTEESP